MGGWVHVSWWAGWLGACKGAERGRGLSCCGGRRWRRWPSLQLSGQLHWWHCNCNGYTVYTYTLIPLCLSMSSAESSITLLYQTTVIL